METDTYMPLTALEKNQTYISSESQKAQIFKLFNKP